MKNPRHILITGASSGLGAALAELYAAPDVRLSLHGRNAERLDVVASKACAKGAIVQQFIGDVTDEPALSGWIRAQDAVQPLDLVIANAGISIGSGGGQEPSQQANALFDTNVRGVMNTIHAALPLMLARKSGQIALMASLASFRGFAGSSSYCACKAAVRVYGEGLRASTAPYNIAVNVICPGYIKTPMTDKNRFPMPFMMSADRAAHIIRKGLERNHPRIAFPWPMYVLVQLVSMLPQDWVNALMWDMPKKGS